MGKTTTWIKGTLIAATTLTALAFMCLPARADNTAEATFKAKCAACHGPDGKGETATGKAMKVRSFADPDVAKKSDEDLGEAIAKGKGKMPAYAKSLNADQIKDLVAHIRALAKK
jgi:mono/diheme cytochrome c family protein